MRNWLEKFQAMAMAVAFAEEGEWEGARSFIDDSERKTTNATIEKTGRADQRPRNRAYRA